MLPEKGGAQYFALILADTLGALCEQKGRPVTFKEFVDAVENAAGIPWAYIHQRYQARLCQLHNTDVKRRADLATGVAKSALVEDPVLGWHYPGYVVNAPGNDRRALEYVVSARLRH